MQFCIWNGLKPRERFKGFYVGRADEGEIPFTLHFHMACLCQSPCLLSVPSWQPDLAGLNEALLNKGTLCFELCALRHHHQPGRAFMLNKVNKYRQAVFCTLNQNSLTTTTGKRLSFILPLSCFTGKKRNPGLKIPKEAFEQPQTSST